MMRRRIFFFTISGVHLRKPGILSRERMHLHIATS